VTGPAVREALHELQWIREGATEEEVAFLRGAVAQAIGRSLETAHARLNMLENIARFGYEDDYTRRRLDYLRGLRASDLDALAERYVHPDRLVVLVAGDRKTIEPQLEALGVGPVLEYGAELVTS